MSDDELIRKYARRSAIFRLKVGILIVGLVLGFATWLGSAIFQAREASLVSQCTGFMSHLAVAVANYESEHGTLPPAYVADSKGTPLYSWRVLILPYTEQQALYGRFNLSEPWDGPTNKPLLGQVAKIFACPTHRDGNLPCKETSYVAVTGPGTAFPGSTPAKLSDIKDELGKTLLFVEVANVDIPWSAPIDFQIEDCALGAAQKQRPFPSSRHDGPIGTVNGAFRRQRIQSAGITAETLRAMSTIDGGEAVVRPD